MRFCDPCNRMISSETEYKNHLTSYTHSKNIRKKGHYCKICRNWYSKNRWTLDQHYGTKKHKQNELKYIQIPIFF